MKPVQFMFDTGSTGPAGSNGFMGSTEVLVLVQCSERFHSEVVSTRLVLPRSLQVKDDSDRKWNPSAGRATCG